MEGPPSDVSYTYYAFNIRLAFLPTPNLNLGSATGLRNVVTVVIDLDAVGPRRALHCIAGDVHVCLRTLIDARLMLTLATTTTI